MIKVNVQSVERVEGPILTIDNGEKLPTTYKYKIRFEALIGDMALNGEAIEGVYIRNATIKELEERLVKHIQEAASTTEVPK